MPPTRPDEQPNSYDLEEDDAFRSRRDSRKSPQPWVVRKLAIAIAGAIIAFTAYVYIGRLCIPMIKRRSGSSLGSRTLGIVFLAVFVVLGMMMTWAYIKVVFTPPGYAIEHVQRQTALDGIGEEQAPSENVMSSLQNTPLSRPRLPPAAALPSQISRGSSTRSIYPSSSSLPSHSNPSSLPMRTRQQSRGSSTLHSHSHSTHRPQPRSAPHSAENGVHTGPYTPTFPPQPTEKEREASLPQFHRPARGRHPPSLPSLREEYRYCRRCEIVKPPRTHHCRACGKCVLKYDHHCPWIGQCVGAQNQKFFFVFVVWSVNFCLWTFATLLTLNVRASTRVGTNIDPQHIIVIVISGVFSIFTLAMLTTHIALISTNQTTLEHISTRAMKDRETAVLDEMHSCCALSAKRRTRQAWDVEWGRIGREGNIWWLGDLRAHWVQVFGPRKWTWFLPIGSTKDLGLDYPRNPRFDVDGRWMPRRQWPPELR
ncbi:DHHC palmitoyltransferase-domain-containing protein [Lactifluus subvellereus]|nr:DHHC palmitoyltransferase-domain-containing protein [Lactifluus subvellereus]